MGLLQRFLSKVEFPITSDGCWNWTAGKDKDGYGQFSIGHAAWRAHRLSYDLFYGDLIKGYLVCHVCDNPSCVKPSHLFLGSPKDNTQDAHKKNRMSDNSKHLIRCQLGEDNLNVRFTEDQVKTIRELSSSGYNNAELGRMYDVPRQTIRQIVTGQTWKHLL